MAANGAVDEAMPDGLLGVSRHQPLGWRAPANESPQRRGSRGQNKLNGTSYPGLRATAETITIRSSLRLRTTFFIFVFALDPMRR